MPETLSGSPPFASKLIQSSLRGDFPKELPNATLLKSANFENYHFSGDLTQPR